MKTRRWLLDYDSTLADTNKARIEAINKRFGTTYDESVFTTWFNEGYMTEEEDRWSWGDQCFLNEDFQAAILPVPHAIEGVKSLLEKGEQMMVVSDRPASLFEVTRDWLDRQGLDTIRLLFTKHKHSKSGYIKGALTKSQAAYLYKLNTVVEDAPHHAEVLSNREYVDHLYLLDYPYNQGVHGPKIERIQSWGDICVE